MPNYLVTGAAGFIGAALAKKLILDGAHVTSIDNLSTGSEANVPVGTKLIIGDCGSADTIQKLNGQKFDAIFHIAGQSSGEISFDNPIYDIQTNAQSTLHLLKYACATSCNRFIFASTMSVYGNKIHKPAQEIDIPRPQSFYGVAKLASEHYIRLYESYGIKGTSLRLFNVYGPGQNLSNLRQGMVSIYLSQMLQNQRIIVKGPKDRFRDLVYIDDVVEAFTRCLNNKNSENTILNFGTGKRTYVYEMIDLLRTFYGKPVDVNYEGETLGDVQGIIADVTKHENILGVWKKTNSACGLKKMLSYYENQRHIA
ncbi:NAD-dependent epimerase/dehydratase family protein [Alphaproteobacteria bacterium]|nr:NAD-dependent epimerase/dehydratase family protein [Alphaproteobacteria bacterium]